MNGQPPGAITVTLTDPANGDIGEPINKKVSVTFSDEMDPATISTTTVKLTGPGGVLVPGTVTCVGLTAVFRPAANLANNTLYTGTVTTGARSLTGGALAAEYTWNFTTGALADNLAPTVTSTDPVMNATGVAINKKIAALFSETMDAATILTTTFTVTGPGATPVAGTVTYVGLTANFTPASNLAPNTLYTVTVTTGAKDLADNALAANYTWTFTTGASADLTAPVVTLVDPAKNATGVATNKKIAVTFSEGMDPTTIKATTFTVTGPGTTPVTGAVSYVGLTAKFTPVSNLANSTLYTVTMSTGVKDLAGNAMAANYTYSFTTGAGADATAPTVVSTDPANAATAVAINKKIAVTLSESLDPTTMNTTTFKVTGPGATPVAGTVAYVGLTANFTPGSNLANNTLYTATVTTGVKDLAGNALAANYTWTFTTGAVADSTAPTVVSTDPLNTAIGVATNKKITVTFSEGMDPTTMNTTTFTMTGPGGAPVAGTVTYVGLIAKFTPDSVLANNTLYTATMNTGAKDLAGNALGANFVWSFTTGAAPDIIAPTVDVTSPLNNAVDVALNQKVTAVFSESMDPDTITNLTFTIAGVPGTVIWDAVNKKATFTSTAKFLANTLYTATITTAAQDLAGNPLAVNKVWSFTTGLRTLAEPVVLGAIAPFGSFGGGAGMTNQGVLTQVLGDIGTTGAATLITGFHDSGGNVYTETPANVGVVTGLIHTATTPPGSVPGLIAGNGALDARTAYTNLSPAALPGGINVSAYGGDPDQLGNRTLLPGIYQSAPGSFRIQGGDLTLDAQGDANAVWVFQMASSLTVGGPGAAFPQSVLLVNGAQAKNVFWQVGSNAVINAGGGGTMKGTIIAEAGAAFSTAGNVAIVRLDGRALGLNASVTLVNTIITIPAP